MLLSYERKFLFLHLQKTAGTSIHRALAPYALRPQDLWENRLLERVGIRVNHVGPYRRKRFRTHCSALDVERNLPRDAFDSLFKFAFVRNPWDLLVSLYSFLPTRPTHRHRAKVAGMSFAEFVEWATSKKSLSQKTKLSDRSGRLLVDFVGYFEHLDEDFRTVCQRIGVDATLAHANSSRHSDYREAYDDRLRDLVAARLADDIEQFGYDFDAGTPQQRQAA